MESLLNRYRNITVLLLVTVTLVHHFFKWKVICEDSNCTTTSCWHYSERALASANMRSYSVFMLTAKNKLRHCLGTLNPTKTANPSAPPIHALRVNVA